MREHTIPNSVTSQISFSPLKVLKVLCGARSWVVSRDCNAVFNNFYLLLWGHKLRIIDGQGLKWRTVPGETIDIESPDGFGVGEKVWDPFSLAVGCDREGANPEPCRMGAWSSFNKVKDLALQYNSSSATVAEKSEGAMLGRKGSDNVGIGGIAWDSLSFVVICKDENADTGLCKTDTWSSLIKAKHLAS